jgi:hypothetical protein
LNNFELSIPVYTIAVNNVSVHGISTASLGSAIPVYTIRMMLTLIVATARMALTLAHLPLTLKVQTVTPVNMGVIV